MCVVLQAVIPDASVCVFAVAHVTCAGADAAAAMEAKSFFFDCLAPARWKHVRVSCCVYRRQCDDRGQNNAKAAVYKLFEQSSVRKIRFLK